MDGILKIMFVEDSLRDVELIWREIEKDKIAFKKLLVDTQEKFLAGLISFTPDIIISDYSLPVFDGMKALLLRNELVPQTPFVLVTGSINEEVAVECMKAGADDYILKENLSRLGPAIISSINKLTLLKQNKAAETALRESEERFRTFYNDAIVGLYRTNLQGKILLANRELVKMLGFKSFEELETRNLNEEGFMTSFHRKQFIDQIEKDGEVKEHEAIWICRDGKEIEVRESAKAIFDTKGKAIYYDGIVVDITDRKKAEKDRQEREKRLRNIFENIQDVYYETSIDGIILEVSPSIAIFSKGLYQRDDLIGKSMHEFYADPGVRQSVISVLEEHGSVHDFEVNLGNNEDLIFNVSISAKIVFNDLGKPEKIIGSMRDISRRKKAEETIQRERIMLRTLIDNLPSIIYVKDIDCRKVIANDADVKNIGFDREEEVIGKSDIELYPGLAGQRGYADDKEVIGSGKAIIDREEDFINSQGDIHWLVTSKLPLYDKNGIITGLVGIGHDITTRKMIEEDLKQSHEFSETLLRTIPFGMDIVDEEGNILFQSENFKKIFGREAAGKKCWELYRDDLKQCSDCPLKKGITIGKTEVYESNGAMGNRILEISHTGMMFQGKKGMLEIFQDITERKKNEAELILAKEKAEEGNRLKTAFLNNISHEIRTPLNAIVGFASILGTSELPADKKKEFVDIINVSNDQLLSIIAGILSMALLETGQEKINEEETNINQLLLNVYEQFHFGHNGNEITFSYHPAVPDSLAFVYTDPVKLMQILVNLVGNALKFTQKGKVRFGYTLIGNMLQFYIEDTGIGIAVEMQELIFEPFRQVDNSATRKYGGVGLGLAISKGYVKLLGGEIMMISEPGKGTVFNFTLPFKPVDKTRSEVMASGKISDIVLTPGKIILVAEDEIYNFLFIQELLSEKSIKILHAWNGKEAVTMVEANPAIHLVLMDIKMPIMDGFEAMQLIKTHSPTLPVIAVSAHAMIEDREKAIHEGFDNYISKPIKQKCLMKVLAEYLG
jgi:PAS domain S-box-containing protein